MNKFNVTIVNQTNSWYSMTTTINITYNSSHSTKTPYSTHKKNKKQKSVVEITELTDKTNINSQKIERKVRFYVSFKHKNSQKEPFSGD